MFQFSKILARVDLVRSQRTVRVEHDSDDLIWVDSLTLSHPKHRGQKDELYSNHIHVGSECCGCDYLIYPIVGYHC